MWVLMHMRLGDMVWGREPRGDLVDRDRGVWQFIRGMLFVLTHAGLHTYPRISSMPFQSADRSKSLAFLTCGLS